MVQCLWIVVWVLQVSVAYTECNGQKESDHWDRISKTMPIYKSLHFLKYTNINLMQQEIKKKEMLTPPKEYNINLSVADSSKTDMNFLTDNFK